MGGGGKTQQTTQKTEIPPEVLARYNAVNARAEAVANTPFQRYSNDPNAFVAPLTQTQQAGIQNVNQMAGAAQPYYGAAATLTGMGAQGVNPADLNVGKYYNPYTQAVAAPTLQALQQQQATERSGLMNPQSMRSFGGDRSGIAAANLARQQALGMAQVMNPIYKGAYDQAMQTAIQQQGLGLSAEQANLQRMLTAGAQFGTLGTGAQAAGLAGAQAQLGAGAVEQQTQQAGLQALLNQFQQERAYPIQMAQMLAGIAEGTGPISGQTVTGTQPAGFFSDERLKENVKRVGETDDGQPIYRYNYKGDDRTQIGLLAQDVEKHHPEAVGLAGGYKTVDYKKATQDAIHKDDGGPVQGAMPIGGEKWDIAGPTAKRSALPMNLQGLGAVHKFAGSEGLPIMPQAYDVSGMMAPKAQGLTLGAIESMQAERASLPGSGPGGDPAYRAWRMGELDKQIAAAGGSPYVAPVTKTSEVSWGGTPYTETYSTGGLAGGERHGFSGEAGSYVHPALAYYQQMAAKGLATPYGVNIQPRSGAPSLPKQPDILRQQPSGLSQVANVADTGGKLAGAAKSAWDARPDVFKSQATLDQEKTLARAQEADRLLKIKQAEEAGLLSKAAHGGLIRSHYDGSDGSFVMPYVGDKDEDPLAKAAAIKHEPSRGLQGGSLPQPAPSGLSQVKDLASTGLALKGAASALPGVATGIGEGLTAAGSGLASLFEALGPAAILLSTGGAATSRQAFKRPGLVQAVEDAPSLGVVPEDTGSGTDISPEMMAKYERQSPEEVEAIIQKFLPKNTMAESGGRNVPNAAGASSAFGPGQITEGTWKDIIRRHPELKDLTEADRFNPEAQMRAMPYHARYLASRFQENELPVTEGNLRLGWAMGHAGGPTFAKNALNNPKALAYTVADPAAVKANPTWFFDDKGNPRTVAEAQSHLVSQLDRGTSGGVAGGKPRATGLAAGEAGRSPIQHLTSGLFPESMSPSTKAALSSENLWIPALAGIGSMLASQRPTLGGAVGEGLVGGAGAYTALQKQQADIEKAKAETGLTKAQTSRARIFIEPSTNTRMLIYADPVTGDERMIRLTEALDRIEKGETFGLEPGRIAQLRQQAAEEGAKTTEGPAKGGAGAGAGAPAPGAATTTKKEGEAEAPAPAPAPSTGKNVPAANPGELSEDDVKLAEKWREESKDKAASWHEANPDIYTRQQQAAKGAADFQAQFTPMAASLAGAPRTGPLAPGPLRDIFVPLSKYINNIANVLQFPEGPIDPAKLADAEEARKYVYRLRQVAREKEDFKAVSALDAIGQGLVSDTNTTKGIARLLAGMSVDTQAEIDKNDYFQAFKQRAEGNTRDAISANRSGSWANLEARFNKNRQPVYQQDKKALERMYLEGIPVKEDGKQLWLTRDGKKVSREDIAAGRAQPMTVGEWLLRDGAKLSDAEKKWVASHYGARSLRYFGLGN